jgi:hypothetical protein
VTSRNRTIAILAALATAIALVVWRGSDDGDTTQAIGSAGSGSSRGTVAPQPTRAGSG